MKHRSHEEVVHVINDSVRRSRTFAAERERLKLPYFDISDDFATAHQAAFEVLFGR
jgi:hypothetical protein